MQLSPSILRLITFIATLWISILTTNNLHAKTVTQAHAHGVHGMVMFGQNNLYVSHLPLYAHPHDWQVILQIVIKDKKLSDAAKIWLKEKSLVTVEPEQFDLMRLNPANKTNPLRSFKANLYIGHFERGGKLWKENVDIEVIKVKEFRQLDPQSIKPLHAEYYVLGDKQQTYLIHRIFGRPDFDQIVYVRNRKNKNNWQHIITNFANTPTNRIQTKPDFENFFKRNGWHDAYEVYFETGDLK